MIYVAIKTHSPKILMVNGTEIGRFLLCLKCVSMFAFYYSILLRSVNKSALTFNTFFEKKVTH